MTFVLSGCVNMTKEQQTRDTKKFPENLLIDTFTGNTCNGKVKVEIKINLAFRDKDGGYFHELYGKFRSVGPQDKILETYLRGRFYLPGGHFYQGVMALYASKPPTLKEYIEYAYGNGRLGDMAYEEAKNSKIALADFERKFGAPPFGNDAKPPQPIISLAMDIARDAEGKGWIGSFDGEEFDDCHEIMLVSKNGKTTGELPLVSSNLALNMILLQNPDKKGGINARKLYWLKVAEQKGHIDAPFRIVQLLEEQAKESPQLYQQVLQDYQSVAENTGDQRAQTALANMYAEGRGTQENPAEAKKWRDLANITLSKAARVCASPKMIPAIYAINQKLRKEAQFAAIIGTMLTGVTMMPGTIRVTEVVAEDVVSMDRPFTCKVYGENIGDVIDASTVPDIKYFFSDGYGNLTDLGDNSGDKKMKTHIANLGKTMANRPFDANFRIEPMGNMHYKLSRNGSLSRNYSITVDLQTEKINNAPQGSPSKQELPHQKEQQVEQTPNIHDWAKDYFNKQ